MNLKKSKNYTITFLILLNLILLLFNIVNNKKNHLSDTQISAITEVLSKDGISIETELPEQFEPSPQYSAKSASYDLLELQNIFFQGSESVKRTEEFDKTIFSSPDASLSIQNGVILYENTQPADGYSYNKNDITELCSFYTSKLNGHYSNLTLDKYTDFGGYSTVLYTDSINGGKIYSNYLLAYVYNDMTYSIKAAYNEFPELVGEKIEICSADEALFIFCNSFKKLYDISNIVIESMDLGYYTADNYSSTFVNLIPHYRIFITGDETPYYVNAYTSSME